MEISRLNKLHVINVHKCTYSFQIRGAGFAAPEYTSLGLPDQPLERLWKVLACGLQAGN